MDVAWLNVVQTARMGLTSMEHWYGLPEAMFTDRTIQDYPLDYNYRNEQHRFSEAGKLWQQTAAPGSDKWNEVMETLLALDFTLKGAEALGAAHEIGSIEVGKLADLVIIEENPLQNLKVLYGTGAIKLTDDNEVVRVGGVKYTIKDGGIVYDAKKLLADVKQMVQEAKEKDGYEIYQPGLR